MIPPEYEPIYMAGYREGFKAKVDIMACVPADDAETPNEKPPSLTLGFFLLGMLTGAVFTAVLLP